MSTIPHPPDDLNKDWPRPNRDWAHHLAMVLAGLKPAEPLPPTTPAEKARARGWRVVK